MKCFRPGMGMLLLSVLFSPATYADTYTVDSTDTTVDASDGVTFDATTGALSPAMLALMTTLGLRRRRRAALE